MPTYSLAVVNRSTVSNYMLRLFQTRLFTQLFAGMMAAATDLMVIASDLPIVSAHRTGEGWRGSTGGGAGGGGGGDNGGDNGDNGGDGGDCVIPCTTTRIPSVECESYVTITRSLGDSLAKSSKQAEAKLGTPVP